MTKGDTMDRFTASAIALLVGLTLIVLGIADVAGSASVLVVAGAVLVLAPLIASFADRRGRRRPAC
jgi:succinate-acetate transporter protein